MTTESDRELLGLAAQANGQPWKWVKVPAYATEVPGILMRDHAHEVDYYPCWNPLENDGDALRLAVKLGLFADTGLTYQFMEAKDCESTRRAIVRAAAAIARATHKEQT